MKNCSNCNIPLDEYIDDMFREICQDCLEESQVNSLLTTNQKFKPVKVKKRPKDSEF
jgi:hypothetical protein